ncbi:hypothetical protein ABL78_6632 [Leptomonas seymouri]|uniref:Uncharacterized protein n=1 Tax=Leptomonas seymouri TaxID=5684 RepID=A0A0N0P3M8_LEPSE|nr:hypothetical protein ABL78_6632 [Leptomonas seymouri]|eukprot:KPI84309.1 hypothetical protein ABL78_6632 [Leptomonas seymouri]
MDTSASVADTSLADVDSIDTPPRVTPLSSRLPKAASASSTKKTTKKTQRGDDDNMEDVFDSQPSSAADSTGRHSPAKEAGRSHTEQIRKTGREGSGDSAATGTTSTAARTLVPSKGSLYSHRSRNKRRTQRQTSSSSVERRTPQLGVAGTAAGLPFSAYPPSSVLAAQYGGQLFSDRSKTISKAAEAAAVNSSTQHVKGDITERIVCSERDPDVSNDTLRRRMLDKENEFDEKIQTIHHTFQNAGEQLVMRDSIIAQLQDELAQLRTEATRIPKDYQVREEKLLLRVEDMMRELREEQTRTKRYRRAADEEVKQLREALHTADKQLAQQQRVTDDILRQLRASDKAVQAEKVKHAAALQECRQIHEDKLTEFQQAYNALQKELVKSHTRSEDAEKDRAEWQAKLLQHELDSRRRHSGDSLRVKELVTANEALREEVEAVQLSMARLLQLMSEVPVLADYLQWNELSSEFVFLGYPTRYFANVNAGNASRMASPVGRGTSPRSQRYESRQTSPARRRAGGCTGGVSSFSTEERSGVDYNVVHPSPASSASAAAAAPYYQDANVSGGSFTGTGVEDGVYAGVASSLSKNVWLNGRWAQQMMDIIASENNFTRLKRIKLLELEEAAQLSEQLPSAHDVLDGRRSEQDYWIPYAVFTEAQKFKNKYYPKLPAMSHFSPFLIRLNMIWRAKLQDRLRVRQGSRKRSASRRQSAAVDSRNSSHRRARGMCNEGEVISRMTSQSAVASQLGSRRSEELLSQLVHGEARLNEIRAEHHRLRRDARLHVSSQKALQLLRQYDELICGAHRSLGDMFHLADQLYTYSSNAANAQTGADEEDRTHTAAMESLHDAQLHAQMATDIAEAVNARDRLLCVVERTCERVCDVGDSLSTRMVSYYSDLHQLLHILHHHIRQLRTRGSTDGGERSSSSSSSSGGRRGGGARTRAGRGEVEIPGLSYKLRSALREQYGTTETLVNDDAPASFSAGSSSIRVDSLLQLAASVLDFGNEVRKEVTDASAALRTISEQAMREAGQLHAGA